MADQTSDADESPLGTGDNIYRRLVKTFADYAIFMLDTEGCIRSWNLGAERIKGYRRDEIVGRHFSQFYPDEARNKGWPEHELAVARVEGRFEDEGWRLRKDGSRFWASVIISALRNDEGELQGYAKITRDLTERKRHEETLRQSEERFRLLMEGVRDYAIFMLDPAGHVMSWNRGAAAIQGYSSDEMIGRHFSQLYPAADIAANVPQQDLQRAVRDGHLEIEGWRVRKDGSVFWAEVIITPIYDDGNVLRGFALVTRDMSERKRLEELELSSRRTNEFLAMLAHELRNPLAPIKNAVDVMQLEPIENPSLQYCRDVIARQLDHMTRLVDDLLDVGRITTGKILLQKEVLDLAAVLGRSIEAARPLIDARRHRLGLELAPVPLPVCGDLTRLAQLFLNLLGNAAKFTPEGGSIDVTAGIEGRSVVARVRDTGIGIAPDSRDDIFSLFVQDVAQVGAVGSGLGIGLTVARSIANMHGGSVEVFSAGPGSGATFTVTLPLYVAPVRAAPTVPETKSRAPTRPKRVLVIDDNKDAADTLAMTIDLLGHNTRTLYGGAEAVAVAAEYRPDIVLLDIAMPGANGFQVLRQLRELPGGDAIVVAAITGFGQETDRQRTRTAGFQHHLVKPVDITLLEYLLRGEL